MPTGVAVPQIEGYVACSMCGDPWLLKIIAARSGGLCNDCYLTHGPTITVKPTAGVTAQIKRSGLRKHRPKKLTPERKARIRAREKARLAALRRLAQAHPVEFAELYADERGRAGLDPWTIDGALRANIEEARAS